MKKVYESPKIKTVEYTVTARLCCSGGTNAGNGHWSRGYRGYRGYRGNWGNWGKWNWGNWE